jgi:hypothetical protein
VQYELVEEAGERVPGLDGSCTAHRRTRHGRRGPPVRSGSS